MTDRIDVSMNLTTTHPHIAKQWHPTLNGLQKPENYTYGSSKKVWWKGTCGHEWDMVIAKRTTNNQNCPYCRNKRILLGYNDLKHHYPLLATEWHPTKNGKNTPEHYVPSSLKKVWWQCNKGHEWEMRIEARTAQKQNCPYCSGRRIIQGQTDLATLNPEIIKQWHPTKNGNNTPNNYALNSHKKVWWQCKEGHEWETRISKRTFAKHNCPICTNQHNHPVYKGLYVGINSLNLTHTYLIEEWHPTKNGKLNPKNFTKGSDKKVWWQCKEGHEWEAYIYKRSAGNNCPFCSSQVSRAEEDIAEFLKNMGLDVKASIRSVISPQELDIYIPSKNVAIEFNGLYWHSERTKIRSYHYDKWLACKDIGIQLIQIWEDDWNRNPELIKTMLTHKLGINDGEKIYARKTIIKEISSIEANSFLKKNHIQGSVNGSIRLGLTVPSSDSPEELVAVIVLKSEAKGETLNLVRYATSQPVLGGFTKLLTHIKRTMKDVKKIITFSDNTISNGDLYKNNGFIATREIAPDYMYVLRAERKHKFGYRLKKFESDPNLKYQKGLTESELADLNNLPRIWDAGKTKWEKIF